MTVQTVGQLLKALEGLPLDTPLKGYNGGDTQPPVSVWKDYAEEKGPDGIRKVETLTVSVDH